jgi:hypothetical protein
MKDGVKESLSGQAAGCDWLPQAGTAGLEVDVKITPFDQDLWNGEISGKGIEAVPGVGEAAYRGFVSPGVLLIKKNGMEIDLLIIALLVPLDKVKAAQAPLANRVLSRL